MGILSEIRRRASEIIAPTLGACVFAYFLFHAFQGDRGLLAWIQFNQQIRHTEEILAPVKAEHAALAAKIALMRSDNLDPDLLDEQARRILGFAAPTDLVILYPSASGAH